MARSIEDQLLDIARERFYNVYDPNSEPELHIVSKTATMWRVVISKYDYCFAQSGSDWAEHNILYGTVIVNGNELVRQDLQLHHESLTERQADDYRPNEIVNQLISKVAEA